MKKGRPGNLLQVIARPGRPGLAGADDLCGDDDAGGADVRRRPARAGALVRSKWTRRTGRCASRSRAKAITLPSTKTAGGWRRNRECPEAHHRRSQLRVPEPIEMKYYLTTPIYYVNAAPHIGHAYTTIVADTVKRFKRMQGYDARLTTGSDEHGVNVERAAQRMGKTPKRVLRRHCGRVRAAVANAGPRRSTASSAPRARSTPRWSRTFSIAAANNGYIYKGSYSGQYCIFDNLYVNEAKPGRPVSGLRTADGDDHGGELLLQAFGVSGQAAGALRAAARLHPAGNAAQRGDLVREGRTDGPFHHADQHQVGDSGGGRSAARVLRLVRCAHDVHERGGAARGCGRRICTLSARRSCGSTRCSGPRS